jgi:hypothetical protein
VTPAAAGTLPALAGLLVGGVAVAFVLAAALVVSGDHSLTLGPGSAALLSLGYACASTATVLGLSAGLRAPTLALVFALASLSTAAALPLWVALPATLVTGLVLAADASAGAGARIGGRVPVAALAGAGAMLLLAGAATADSHPAPEQVAHGGAAAVLQAPAKPRAKARARHAAPAKPAATPATPAATPAIPAPTAARPAPADFVRAYYAALDQHRFADAWTHLSPAVKARFGTFAHWRAGYATTLASAPEDIKVAGSATVRHVLVARDRTTCGGTREQRFAVTWKLVPAASDWVVATLTATAIGPAAQTTPCQ